MPQFEQVSVFSSLIFWSLISFGLFLWMMAKFALPPILQALEERQKRIQSDIQSAEDLKVAAESLKKDFEAQLQTAHEKATTIVQLAQEVANKIKDRTLNETQAKCRQMQKDAEHEIMTTRNQLLREIRDYVSELTIASTEKILNRSLTDEDRSRLVGESIEDVVKQMDTKN